MHFKKTTNMSKLLFVCLFSLTGAYLFGQFSFTNRTSWLAHGTVYSGVPIGVADMNNDGLDDIVRLDQSSKVLIDYQPEVLNQFTGYSYGPLLGKQWTICIADVDQNGFNDIFTGGNNNGLKLLKAADDGSEYTLTTITQNPIFIQGSNFADIDNDGDVDIFACHDNGKSQPFNNNGTGQFTLDYGLINAASTVPSDNSGNYGSVWTDYDNDGDIDLYISKCRQGVNNPMDGRRLNLLFRNNGDGTFTDVAEAAGLRPFAQSWATDFADIDNDGDMDCFIVAHDVLSMLMRNNGDGTFTDITQESGMVNALNLLGAGIQCKFADFDNDGFVDLVISTIGLGYGFFHNNGDLTFTQKSNALPSVNYFQSLATGDLNNDGFIDLVTGFAEGYNTPSSTIPDALFINNGNSNHHLKVRLQGVTSNLNGIGARLELYGDWGVQMREIRSGESYGIMTSLIAHFGLADHLVIDSLVVRWPSGIVDKLINPSPNQTLFLVEGSNCQPSLGFSYQVNGLSYSFLDESTVGAQTWFWDFGDGLTSDEPAPLHEFTASGSYEVCLTVEGDCGNGTTCQTLNVNCVMPDAIFGKIADGLTLTFQDQSLNDPVAWLWTFGDDASSEEQNPVHTFAEPGEYYVCLVAYNLCGQSSETCSLITVGCNSTEAGFTYQANELSVDFSDASTEDATAWFWNFGDGFTSTQPNPDHTFEAPGTYQVCLTVTGLCGNETTCVVVTVACPPPVIVLNIEGEDLTYLLSASAPGATDFQWTIDDSIVSEAAELVYDFTATGSYEVCLQATGICGASQACTAVDVSCAPPVPDFTAQANGLTLFFTSQSTGIINNWSWDFGDGSSGQSMNIVHAYAAPGEYEVCLNLDSPCGPGQVCQTITVTCAPPQAEFFFFSNDLHANFTNNTQNQPATYVWTFGDGGISTETNPVHDYDLPGEYEVCLTAIGPVCGQTQICQTVAVTCPAPQASFAYNADELSVDLTNLTSDPFDSVLWDFGDGSGSTQSSVNHVFDLPGTYEVCLTTGSVCGENQICQEITVSCTPPAAAFSIVADGVSVQFTDQTGDQAAGWLWDFGDGSGSTENNPVHNYAVPGTYSVCLTVSSLCGQSDTCMEVTVTCAPPQALFSPSGIGLNQVFLDASSNEPTAWFWDFGDGGTSTDQNPFHIYAQAGNYNICLTVSNACGEDTHCQTVTVTTTAVLDPDLQARIRLSPNPTAARFRIDIQDPPAGNCTLRIYDINGVTVQEFKEIAYRQEFDLGEIAGGMYFLHFVWDDRQALKKLVVVRP